MMQFPNHQVEAIFNKEKNLNSALCGNIRLEQRKLENMCLNLEKERNRRLKEIEREKAFWRVKWLSRESASRSLGKSDRDILQSSTHPVDWLPPGFRFHANGDMKIPNFVQPFSDSLSEEQLSSRLSSSISLTSSGEF